MTSRWRHEPIGGPRQLEGGEGGLIVLKDGPLFLVQPANGKGPVPEAGFFYRDTRFLNGLEWWIGTEPMVVLSTAIYDSNRAQIDLTNPDLTLEGRRLHAHSLHFRLTLMVVDRLFLRWRQINFSQETLAIRLTLRLRADFRDIFEVREVVERSARGQYQAPLVERDQATFSYHGIDGLTRTTTIAADPAPNQWHVTGSQALEANYHLVLQPRVKQFHYVTITPRIQEQETPPSGSLSRRFSLVALKQARASRDWAEQCTVMETDNRVFNHMLRQASADMRALMTSYPEGRIVDAGIPWYVAPFGRDAAITGIETLLLNPDIAKDSLTFLAKLQGQTVNDWRDEEPGKILHERRQGELAQAGEIPHTPYYGSIDSTLWWIIALYETWRYTHDTPFLQGLEAPLIKAVEWIGQYGDHDHDGFLEYLKRAPIGLENQGWKDSFDSIRDAHGQQAIPPIALVEVQGYAYYALRCAAEMFRALGDVRRAEIAHQDAQQLKIRFNQVFINEETRTILYALDGEKRPVRAVISNEGHLLFTGILPPRMARTVIARLMHPDMLSGYGIRTLSQSMPFYNPMSYHNGSVWPHDNAIVAWGLKGQGAIRELMVVSHQLYEAAQYFPAGRLPELYCGFTRRAGAGPVQYPVACNPQAWSAAVPFFLLRLWLGITVHGHEVRIQQPELPPWINEIYLDRLQIGGGELTVEFARGRGVTYANVLRHKGPLQVVHISV